MTNWYQSSKSSAMADGTRIKSFEDSIRKVEALLQQLQQIKEQHQQLEKQTLIQHSEQKQMTKHITPGERTPIQPNLGANLGGTSSNNQYHQETPPRESLLEPSSLEAWPFMTSTQDFTTESDKQYEEQNQINESQSRQDEIEKSTKDIASYPQIVEEFVDEQRNQRLNFAIVDELQTFQEGIEAQSHGNTEEPRICHKPSKVIPDSLPIIMVEAALEKVVEGDDFCFVDQLRTDVRLRKMSDLGMVSIGLLKIPIEYEVFVENTAHGREFPNEIGKILESFALAYNLFDEMPMENLLALGVNRNLFLAVFDPGGRHVKESSVQGNCNIISWDENACVMSSISMYGVMVDKDHQGLVPFDKGQTELAIDAQMKLIPSLVFDPGGMCHLESVGIATFSEINNAAQAVLDRSFDHQFRKSSPNSWPFDRGRANIEAIQLQLGLDMNYLSATGQYFIALAGVEGASCFPLCF